RGSRSGSSASPAPRREPPANSCADAICIECREMTERLPQSRQAPAPGFAEPWVERTMALWHFVGEPTLDELIEDEMMIPVMRSAGIDAVRLRAAYVEMARRRRGD